MNPDHEPGMANQTTRVGTARRPRPRPGYTIVELMVVMILMGVLTAVVAPSFQRAVEQSKADIVVADLRAIWAAERLYWIDNRAYAPDLATLAALDLIDGSLVSDTTSYVYAVASADLASFRITATRQGSARWQGSITIDQTGAVTGGVHALGEADIIPVSQ